jgi:Tetratricopeptide repeat
LHEAKRKALQSQPSSSISARDDRTLLAVYDLSVAPVSFDFAIFIALADLHRQRLGLTSIHVIFVPAPGEGFWDREALGLDDRRWRIRNLLMPLCWLWPSCRGVTVLGARDEARHWLRVRRGAIFPVGYRLSRPVPDTFLWANLAAEHACGEMPPVWQAPPTARALVQQWLDTRAAGRRVVIITLREADYYSELNSNIEAWAAFARSLDPRLYLPVIVRDTMASFGPLPPALEGLTVFPEASLTMEIRAALYEMAFIGLSVGTGPMTLQWLNPKCRFVIFRLLIAENFRSRPTPLRSMGIEIGGQLSTGSPFHRFVWEEDGLDVIKREFDRIVGEIDAAATAIAPSVRPGSGEPPLRMARRLRETHRLAPARRIYRHLLEQAENRAAAHYGLCLVELATPRRFRIWRYFRGFCHYVRGRLVEVSSQWKTADQALEIAEARERWRDAAAAETIYRSILSEERDQPTALHRLGRIALRRGATDEAIELLKRAAAGDPHTAAVHYDLAEALSAVGRREDAMQHYRMATSCDPSHELARERLSEVTIKGEQEDVAA